MHAIIRNDTPELLPPGPFTDAEGTLHPAAALDLWSAEELAAVGVYRVQADAVPEGQIITGHDLVLDGDVVRQVWTLEPAPQPDLAAYAEQRYAVAEVAGTTWNGLPIRTDEKAQGKMQAEMLAIAVGIRQDGDGWEYGDGVLRPTTNADMTAIASTARAYVMACLAKLHEIKPQLGDTIATAEQIDAKFAEVSA